MAEIAAFSDHRGQQPDDLNREDRRAGDQARPSEPGRGPNRPEPAEFEAKSEPIAKRFAKSVTSDMVDPGIVDGSDLAGNRGEQGGFVDLVGRQFESDLAEDGEVVARQAVGALGRDWPEKRRVFEEDDRSIQQRGARVVVLDQTRGGDEFRVVGKRLGPGFEPAGLGQARVLGEDDDSPSGRLQADPTEPRDAGAG
jgi:hypothetical protein